MSYGKLSFVVTGMMIAAFAVACGKKTDNKTKTKATAAPTATQRPSAGSAQPGTDATKKAVVGNPGKIQVLGAVVDGDRLKAGLLANAVKGFDAKTKVGNKADLKEYLSMSAKFSETLLDDVKGAKGALVLGCGDEDAKALIPDGIERVEAPAIDPSMLSLKASVVAICGPLQTKANAIEISAETLILKDARIQVKMPEGDVQSRVGVRAHKLVVAGKTSEISVMEHPIVGETPLNTFRITLVVSQSFERKDEAAGLFLQTVSPQLTDAAGAPSKDAPAAAEQEAPAP